MTSKEKVRISIYKTLLAEEKKKNKSKNLFSIAFFLIGIGIYPVFNSISPVFTETQPEIVVNSNDIEPIIELELAEVFSEEEPVLVALEESVKMDDFFADVGI